MIINLANKKLKIKSRPVPETLHKVAVQYTFELNTNHLTPKLTIGAIVFIGNRIHINLEEATVDHPSGTVVPMKVELVDDNDITIRTYVGEFPCYKYGLMGQRLVRPDFETYIRDLELENERLIDEGEVI